MRRAVVPSGLVASLVLLAVGAGVLGWSMSPERTSVTVTSNHSATVLIPGTPYGPPPGWKEVRIEGFSLWVPGSWTVRHTVRRDCSVRPFVVLTRLHDRAYSFTRCGVQPASVLIVAFRSFPTQVPEIPDRASYDSRTVRRGTGAYTTTVKLITGTLGVTVDIMVRSDGRPPAGGPALAREILSSLRVVIGSGRGSASLSDRDDRVTRTPL